MKSLLGLGLGTIGLLAAASTLGAETQAQSSFPCGTAYSVGAEEGSLLILKQGEFRLLTVGRGAVIRDGKGRPMALSDIRPGDSIEYWPESRKRDFVANTISVNSRPAAECAVPTVVGRR